MYHTHGFFRRRKVPNTKLLVINEIGNLNYTCWIFKAKETRWIKNKRNLYAKTLTHTWWEKIQLLKIDLRKILQNVILWNLSFNIQLWGNITFYGCYKKITKSYSFYVFWEASRWLNIEQGSSTRDFQFWSHSFYILIYSKDAKI